MWLWSSGGCCDYERIMSMKFIKILFLVFFAIPLFLGIIISIGSNNSPNGNSGLVFLLIITGAVIVWTISSIKKSNQKQKEKEEKEQRIQEAFETAEQIKAERIQEIYNITDLPVVANPMAIVLKPGEICHFQTAASVEVIKQEVIGRTTGHGGVSVRVAKGITLHSGSSQGHSIKGNVAYTYPGFITMTNQRIVMTGEKGFDFPISKLTSMTPYIGSKYPDGITLQFGKSVFNILMDEPYWIPKIIDLLNAQ